MKKSFFYVTLCFMLSVSACYSKPTVVSELNSLEEKTPPPAVVPDAIKDERMQQTQDRELVNISFAIDETERPKYEGLVAEFESTHSGIIITLVSLPNIIEYWNAETLRGLAELADTVLFGGSRTKLLEHPEYFIDQSPILDVVDPQLRNDFWNGSLSACAENDGTILGLPISLSPIVMFFDPQQLSLSGLNPPTIDWSLDDFLRLGKNIQNDGRQVFFLDFPSMESSIIAPFLSSQIQEFSDTVKLNEISSEFADYRNLIQANKIQAFGEDFGVAKTGEKALFWVAPLSYQQTYRTILDTTNEILSYPGLDNFSIGGTTPIFSTCGLISNGSKHPTESFLWLNFLSDNLYQANENENQRYQVPAKTSVAAANFPWEEFTGESQASIRRALNHGWYGPVDPWKFSTLLKGVESVLYENAAIETLSSLTLISHGTNPDTEPITIAPVDNLSTSEPGTINIRFLYPSELPNSGQVFADLAEEFHALHPSISVDLSGDFSWPGGDPFPYLAKYFDCFAFRGQPYMNPQLMLTDLVPLITGTSQDISKDFLPGRLVQTDNRLFTLPLSNDVTWIRYNTDLLTELGISIPSLDWTGEDLLDLMQEIEAKSQGRAVFASEGLDPLILEILGADFFVSSVPPDSMSINNNENETALSEYVELSKSRQIHDTSTEGNLAYTGQVALWLEYSYKPEKPAFNTGILPIPRLNIPSKSTGWLPAYNGFISNSTNAKGACWDWLNFLTQKSSLFPGLPVRISTLTSQEFLNMNGIEKASLIQQALQNSETNISMNMVVNPIYLWLGQVGQSALSGETLDSILAETQHKVDGYLMCVKESGLLNRVITVINTQNKSDRIKLGDCASSVDPSFNRSVGYQ